MGSAGNSSASRDWKGSIMLKKAVFLWLALFAVSNISALDFKHNGILWNSISSEELEKLSYTIAFRNTNYQGISIDEVFPAVFEAWALIVKSSGNSQNLKLADPELAEKLSSSYLLKDGSSWSLYYNGNTYSNILELDISCEPLDTSELEIWINWEGAELLRAEIERYSMLHKVDINVIEVPKPDSKMVSITQANGSVPDIVMVQSSYIDRLSKSECIQKLGFIDHNRYIDQGIDAFISEGKLWAIPFYYDAQMLFYNPGIIETPDFNWTLDDFEAACRKASEKVDISSAWNAYSASFLIPFQMAFGKDRIIESDGSIIIDDQPTLQALDYIISLKDRGLMQPIERDAMTSMFVSGKAAMIISASYSIPHFESLGIPFKTAPLPVNSLTGRRVAPLLDFKAFAIAKRSKNTRAAQRLIEYMTGTGVQQRFTSATAKLPALEKVWLTIDKNSPYYETLSISSTDGIIIPTDKAYSIYKNTMWKMLRFALSGKMSPSSVLQKTQELVNKNLEELEY